MQKPYFPVEVPYRPRFNLRPLGTDFGGGARDDELFQRDGQVGRYLENKRALLRSHPSRHIGRHAPYERLTAGALAFATGVLGETADNLDALMMRVQEDAMVVDMGGTSRICYVHVCSPNGFPPTALLGRSLAEAHAPVPRFAAKAAVMDDAIRSKVLGSGRPQVQFVWGLTRDDRLNHHPEAYSPEASDNLYLRVERQVLSPLEEGVFFTIRTYVYDVRELSQRQREVIIESVRGMDEGTLRYKRINPRCISRMLRSSTATPSRSTSSNHTPQQ